MSRIWSTSGYRVVQGLATIALTLAALVSPTSSVASAAPSVTGTSSPAFRVVIPSSAGTTVREDRPDATDGGIVAVPRQIVVPSLEIGLSRARPIPFGVTCSCTIDRVGLVSQFDITVLEVVQDAMPMIQQLNRFNPPPSPGNHYVAAYVGQQYIAGPQDQAYMTSDADWRATTTMPQAKNVEELFHTDREYRPRADVYPGDYVNGWLFFELPLNKPAFIVWHYNFVGERGVWFSLQ